MHLYRLTNVAIEGEPQRDRWFGSLADAKSVRSEWIRAAKLGDMADCLNPEDVFAIDKVTLRDRTRKGFALAVLNRIGYIDKEDRVVEPYKPTK